jgi:hypothetical protein
MNIRLLITTAVTAAAFWCSSAFLLAKPPCELSEVDYASLANNAAGRPLDRAAIDALSEKDAANLCKARAFVAHVRPLAGPNVKDLSDQQAEQIAAKISENEIAVGTSRFVSEEEWKFIRVVVGDVMARMPIGKQR